MHPIRKDDEGLIVLQPYSHLGPFRETCTLLHSQTLASVLIHIKLLFARLFTRSPPACNSCLVLLSFLSFRPVLRVLRRCVGSLSQTHPLHSQSLLAWSSSWTMMISAGK